MLMEDVWPRQVLGAMHIEEHIFQALSLCQTSRWVYIRGQPNRAYGPSPVHCFIDIAFFEHSYAHSLIIVCSCFEL